MTGFLGNRILVNGQPRYAQKVVTRPHRLRILNGSNSRIYNLAWADGRPLTVIGTDGGLLSAPIVRPNVLLGPAERVEVWADFSGMGKGDEATLVSRELDLGPLSGMTGPGGMRGPAAGGRLVATVMSNLGLERYLKDHGIGLERTSVGDRYVVEDLPIAQVPTPTPTPVPEALELEADRLVEEGYVTRTVAEAVGEELRAPGTEVEVRRAKEIRDLGPYQAVVVGVSVHMGRLPGELPRFVKRHHQALSHMSVAYFVVCLTMAEDTPENRQETLSYLKPLRKAAPEVEPVDIGLFAGAVLDDTEEFDRLFFLAKAIPSIVGIIMASKLGSLAKLSFI